MSKVFRSKDTGKLITLVDPTEQVVSYHLTDEPEGLIHTIKASQLTLQYEAIEKEEIAAVIEKSKAKPKSTSKKQQEKPDYSQIFQNFFDFVSKMEEQVGITLFTPEKTKNFYSLKVEGKMYMAFTTSPSSGLVLWLRSEAVKKITPYKKMNHMFDARVQITEWSLEIYQLLVKIHDESLKYQLLKNTKK